jgi:predicted nuclease of predicted toxin-antitoxin system
VRFLADECVAPFIVASLRAEGHDVLSILEGFPSASDLFVMALAVKEQRILLTEDNDYGELIFHHGVAAAPAVLLLRLPSARRSERWPRLNTVLDELGDRVLGSYVVVQPDTTRIRKLPSV